MKRNGVIYEYDRVGFNFELQNLAPVDFSRNPQYEQKFRFYDQQLYDAVLNGDPDVHIFFRHLALCHTVMAEERTGESESSHLSFTDLFDIRSPVCFL